VHKFAEKLLDRACNEQSFQACLGVFRLTIGYPNDRVDKACQKALEDNSCSYRLVQSILVNNLDKEDTAVNASTDFKLPTHENLRGSESYQ
jgi:hypothetical protein